jgi:hypothetical protein
MTPEEYLQIRFELENYPRLISVMPSDLFLLPTVIQDVLNQAFREGRITLAGLALALGLDPLQAGVLAGLLVEKGFLQNSPLEAEPAYLARFGGRIRRPGGSPMDKI